mmetsp:Transcript_56869/g.176998  ORF Transcript_56869/g.176998 Transcript_56869/m.176998 type:complete len:520 (-) Transcript_56869:14-1573(-)
MLLPSTPGPAASGRRPHQAVAEVGAAGRGWASAPSRPASARGPCRREAVAASAVVLAAACGRRGRRSLLRRRAQPPNAKAAQPPACAQWHAARRRAILAAHPEIADLVGPDWRTLPLIAVANLLQLGAAAWCGLALNDAGGEPAATFGVVALACGLGGTLSLWSFAVLHDLVHGTVLWTDRSTRDSLLFWLSFPTIFGYYLYLQRGHLSHHRNLGRASMGQLFDSSRREFEDGDVLFVAHRQPLAGRPYELRLELPGWGTTALSPSISHNIFSRLWDRSSEAAGGQDAGAAARGARNAVLYSFSMVFERFALAVNDKLVALTGTNFFFPNKPAAFHEGCATYARAAALLHLALLATCGPGALLYLLVAEVAWQLPVHPACAMFVSNHGSGRRADGRCAPTSSLYVGGPWGLYDWVCLFSNYHLEHHDFPDVGLLRLPEVARLAPEFYGLPPASGAAPPAPAELAVGAASTDWLATVAGAFAAPQPYACSLVEGVDDGYAGEEDSAAWAAAAGPAQSMAA